MFIKTFWPKTSQGISSGYVSPYIYKLTFSNSNNFLFGSPQHFLIKIMQAVTEPGGFHLVLVEGPSNIQRPGSDMGGNIATDMVTHAS